MSLSYWPVVLAFGLIVGAGLSAQEVPNSTFEDQPVTHSGEDEGAARGEYKSPPEQPHPINVTPALEGIETAIRELIAEQDQRERDGEKQRDIRDLEAQESMAVWAKRMFWATVSTVILTSAGLILIWWTLREARATTVAANKLYELETRPFLSIELIDGEKFRIKDGKMGIQVDGVLVEQDLLCRLVNGGRTVAIAKKFCRSWHVAPVGKYPANTTGGLAKAKAINVPVGPNAPSPPISTHIDKDALPNSGQWLFFHGFLEFSNQSGSLTGAVGFCYLYNPNSPSRGFYVALPQKNNDHWYYKETDAEA